MNKTIRLCAAILAAMGTVLTFGCADGNSLPPPSFATNTGPGLENAYRLDIGDKVKLSVFDEENISGEYEVNGRGNMAVPLIGEIPAKGRSLKELKRTLSARLANGYIKNPRISLDITNYRPIYVHGEVKSGGKFQYHNNLTFEDAVAMAGGYTYRAQKSYLILTRAGQRPVRLPLPASIPVLPGDNILISERFF
ncbi:MAG: polysaccharide export protein [Alphaproteobacteria bacterium]|nr:polysaccharide export protein [Alphaproteobacteria bacterium]